MEDICSVIFIILAMSGGLLTGMAGTNYKFRNGKILSNPQEYNKNEKRLFTIGGVLLIVGFLGFIICNIYLQLRIIFVILRNYNEQYRSIFL